MSNNGNSPDVAVSQWLKNFEEALQAKDMDAVQDLFLEESFWRDLVSFTWNIKTMEGRGQIRDMLKATLQHVEPRNWKIQGTATQSDAVVEAWITFETSAARAQGHLRLKDGKCWTLLTAMQELKGHEEKKNERRIAGAVHGTQKKGKNWLETKLQDEAELGYDRQPYCVIIGGGQGGIALGARLKRLSVPTIILEKNARAGDSWRNRYKSLCLHDPVWYDHLPYLPFPDDWPVFTPKDKLGDWLEMYVKVMELNYWSSTECKSAGFDEATQKWVVTVNRNGKEIILRPSQLIFALGVSGYPNVPKIAGSEIFEGVQHHSSKHPGGDAYTGKKCIVLGSNNSAHDICADLWENGADVTMIQRSSTHVAKSASIMKYALGALYSEEALKAGMTTERADLTFASVPYGIMHTFHIPVYQQIARQDVDFYDRLTKSGFLLDFGDDGSGLFMKYLRRGSGYYIDVGAAELVAEGKIKLQSGVNIDSIRKNSVVLSNHTELPADVIVYATGYGSMNNWVARIVSPEVANRVGKCWGLGSNTKKDPGPWEGELRNMWKPTNQPALWFHGGNLHQSRHYSLYLSLQIKARMEEMNTPVYGISPVHHLQ